MQPLLALLMILVGMLLPVQAGINAEFRRHAGHPLWAGVVNFIIGLIAIVVLAAVTKVPLPAPTKMMAAPWWAWLGGFMGAAVVVLSLIAAPRLGATLLVACLICGQLTASLLVDHFGWVAYSAKTITPTRLLGVTLLVAGVLLIQRNP